MLRAEDGRPFTSHARIQRLLTALGDAARCEEPGRARWMLSEIWDRVIAELGRHCDTEDIRRAIAQTRLHDVGGQAWWRAVTAAITAIQNHVGREETAGGMSPN
ncbi:MAG TPA: hypothetical protein VN969_04860 [Streptosporangiaceae bacterium]|jgi:hypothetical protein|nr:hypothetical protein [Streptosporangiaceae bacterium]